MKRLIDKFYTENYSILVSVAKRRITQMGKSIEAESVVSSSYLYVVGKAETITEDEISKLAFGFICMELSLYNTQTNIKENLQSKEMIFINEESNQNQDIILNIDIEGFELTLDRYELILWSVYKRGYITKRDIAKHFNIDSSSAYNYIKSLKNKFIKYVSTEETV